MRRILFFIVSLPVLPVLAGCSLAEVTGADQLARIEADAAVRVAQAQAAGHVSAAKAAAEASVARSAVWASVTPDLALILAVAAVAVVFVAGMWWYRRRRLDLEIVLAQNGWQLEKALPAPRPRKALSSGSAVVITMPAQRGELEDIRSAAQRRLAQHRLLLTIQEDDNAD